MSTLSSASTTQQIKDAYDDNASYLEDGSVTKCKAFITAVTMLLRRLPTEHGRGAERLRLDENIRQLNHELKTARAWLTVNGGGGNRVRFTDFSNFRS